VAASAMIDRTNTVRSRSIRLTLLLIVRTFPTSPTLPTTPDPLFVDLFAT